MTRKQRRLFLIAASALLITAATALTLTAFQEDIVYFYSPTELKAKGPAQQGRALRLGGLVEDDSVRKEDGGLVTRFKVTDLQESVTVVYEGILPDLFREGQGVVTQGTLGADGVFTAEEVLAKHDENYMPREVKDALEKSGEWRGEEGKTTP